MSLHSDALASMVGRTATYTAPDAIGAAAIRYFADAIGDPDPIYRDRAAALAAGFKDIPAPPTMICETNQYVDGEPNADGYRGHEWGFDLPGTRQLRGGNSYLFVQTPIASDVVTAEWTIDAVDTKTTGDGTEMIIVRSVARYSNQHGEALATNTETIIFQEVKQ